jgi:hypothetical protein
MDSVSQLPPLDLGPSGSAITKMVADFLQTLPTQMITATIDNVHVRDLAGLRRNNRPPVQVITFSEDQFDQLLARIGHDNRSDNEKFNVGWFDPPLNNEETDDLRTDGTKIIWQTRSSVTPQPALAIGTISLGISTAAFSARQQSGSGDLDDLQCAQLRQPGNLDL